jgi:catechol 2,3-dioxygenase-like lactoylglutathione lyase family enzyme/DNA-binding CsgD family transcriptional regulator
MSGRRGRPRHPDVLTPAEWRTVHAVRHGLSNREIAVRLGVSRDAVKYHVANAIAKLGLADRQELRAWVGAPADSAIRHMVSPLPLEGCATKENTMKLGQIGQISRTVRDIERSVTWYRDVLGLTHLYTFGDLAFFDCAGTRLFLSVAEKGEDPGSQSILYFRVDDIHATCAELTSLGVEIISPPHLIHKHESGVEEWMAFFNDPDGHPLALMTQVGPHT